MTEYSVLNWLAAANYHTMMWMADYYWWSYAAIFFLGCLFGMTPFSTKPDHEFRVVVLVKLRRILVYSGFTLLALPFITAYAYDASEAKTKISDGTGIYIRWFLDNAYESAWLVPVAMLAATIIRFFVIRYILTFYSGVLRKLRKRQTDDELSDIKKEFQNYRATDYLPSKFYKDGELLLGLDKNKKPIRVGIDEFNETNAQIIGPTRYGKGIIMQMMIEQLAKAGNTMFFIDPKSDKFVHKLLFQAAQETNRKFVFIDLNDGTFSRWAPFYNGSYEDGLSRLFLAFGLEYTGDAGTDYYKSQEHKILIDAFRKTRTIKGLYEELKGHEGSKAEANLYLWRELEALNPKSGDGIKIDDLILDDAIVYVRGSMRNQAIKTATKIFILDAIQSAMRLEKERKSQITLFVDEVRFLASKELADALATMLGFGVNTVLAYQSINDLLSPDDVNLNGKSLLQSVNVNCQIKAIYGGADFETADWVSKLSGSHYKAVTSREETEIKAAGGEYWNRGRTISNTEEALIPANVALALPPKICILFKRFGHAKACFTSFVPVKDEEALDQWLSEKLIKRTPKKTNEVQSKDKSVPAKPANTHNQTRKKKKPNNPSNHNDEKVDKMMESAAEALNQVEQKSDRSENGDESLNSEKMTKNQKRKQKQKERAKNNDQSDDSVSQILDNMK